MTSRAAERTARSDLYRRAFDILVSAILLVLVLPVVLVTIVGSALALRAWPLFVQERVGREGRRFRFFKVRTLPPDTPAYTDKHRLDHSRIPAFCRALRSLHLDELPQLLLVLRGHMSLVGPRPEMECLHSGFPSEFARLRTATRPGCTGLWQVSDACSGLISAAPQYDLYYIAHRTLRLDLWVLYRTALSMAGVGRGIRLSDVPRWALRADPTEVIDLRDRRREEAMVHLHATGAMTGGGVRLQAPAS